MADTSGDYPHPFCKENEKYFFIAALGVIREDSIHKWSIQSGLMPDRSRRQLFMHGYQQYSKTALILRGVYAGYVVELNIPRNFCKIGRFLDPAGGNVDIAWADKLLNTTNVDSRVTQMMLTSLQHKRGFPRALAFLFESGGIKTDFNR